MLLTVTWPTIHERLSLFYVKKGHISTEKATTCKIPVKRNKPVPCTVSAARPSLAVESGDLLSICSRSLICLKSGDAISRFTQSCSWLPEGENLEHQDTLSFTSAELQCTNLDFFLWNHSGIDSGSLIPNRKQSKMSDFLTYQNVQNTTDFKLSKM